MQLLSVSNNEVGNLVENPVDDVMTDFSESVSLPASEQVTISTEKLPSRQRRILATVVIPKPLEQVWQILTDYDRLAEFVPNLTVSRHIEHPTGGIRLEQIGAQCFLNIKFCARVILDMQEHFPKELTFSMVEGDFKDFFGTWRLQPTQVEDQVATLLSYELTVKPPLVMPLALIERHLCYGITQNLLAIQQRTLDLCGA